MSRITTHFNVFLKRDVEEQTWLILGGTLIAFAIVAGLGLSVLCYRHRSNKKLKEKKRMAIKKDGKRYTQIDEEKGDATEMVAQPLIRPVAAQTNATGSPKPHSRSQSTSELQYTPPPPGVPTQTTEDISQRDIVSHFDSFSIQHPHDTGIYLPPPAAASHTSSRRNSSPESIDAHDHEYDGRTGRRFDRSSSPGLGGLLLSRSASMLRPRQMS